MMQFVVVGEVQKGRVNYPARRLGKYQALEAGPGRRRAGETAGEKILSEK